MSNWQVAFLRAALFWLVATGAVGVWTSINPGMVALVSATHAHMGILGFFLAMVMGVAFWMMPRPGGIRQKGFEAVTFLLLQTGLVLRVVGEPWWRSGGGSLPHTLFVASGVFVLLSMLTFAYAMSKRVVTMKVIHAKGLGRRRPVTQPKSEQE
ncbi:MAG: hypothetical protein WDA03_09940 [Trueperaceae bacterium]